MTRYRPSCPNCAFSLRGVAVVQRYHSAAVMQRCHSFNFPFELPSNRGEIGLTWRVEHCPPEIAVKAMIEAEAGWQKRYDKIGQRAGLD